MVVHPAPTSPKQQLKSKVDAILPDSWSTTPIVQPPRIPWGRISLLTLALSLIGAAGAVTGWGIIIQRYPDAWIAQWWPAATTVIRQERQVNSEIPSAVQQAAEQLLSLVRQNEASEIYTAAEVATTAVRLSGSGWALAWGPAVPEGNLAVIPNLGAPVQATGRTDDPAGSFVYLRTEELGGSPVTLWPLDVDPIGRLVWVVSAQIHRTEIIGRRVVGWDGPVRSSSERLERWLTLDAPVTSPAGSAVLDQQGRLVGLLGVDQTVWPTMTIDPILKSLLQLGLIERPSLGVRALDRSAASVASDPAARGWLITADPGSEAVLPGSPAAEADLQPGDIIVSLNDQTPKVDLFTALANFQPAQRLTIVFQRAGVTKQTSVELGTLQR